MTNPRIISGKARGHRLRPVPGDITRPITDRVKEALFNILGADIVGSSLLDLFAGTGSVGIEALSRGASFVRFVDLNRLAIETLRYNLENTGLRTGAEIVKGDAFTLLKREPDRAFDYIFIAPPQYKEMWHRALTDLDAHIRWLTDDGWIIVQIDPKEYKSLMLTNFVEIDQRKYGSTLLLFFAHRDQLSASPLNDPKK